MIINTAIKDIKIQLRTVKKLFSPDSIDRGTLAMLSVVDLKDDDKVLDLGCGYGIVGIYAAKIIGSHDVVMTDIEEIAVSIAKENTVLNGVNKIRIVQGDAYDSVEDNDFSIILVNPPYHADFSVPKRFIEKGFRRLRMGGKMYMVTKRKEWYKNKMISIFGGVKIHQVDGYYVFESERRYKNYAKRR
ncbi:MAG: class I SAM-dependent methyltransferase [Firmicutes bacterium]|nr:class I SAM-dependent methyltransferase [Bacillota bacterium]